jgi:hypothetical protein
MPWGLHKFVIRVKIYTENSQVFYLEEKNKGQYYERRPGTIS